MADKKKKRRPRYEWTLIVRDEAGSEYPFVVVAPEADVAVEKAEAAFGGLCTVRVVKASEVFWEA